MECFTHAFIAGDTCSEGLLYTCLTPINGSSFDFAYIRAMASLSHPPIYVCTWLHFHSKSMLPQAWDLFFSQRRVTIIYMHACSGLYSLASLSVWDDLCIVSVICMPVFVSVCGVCVRWSMRALGTFPFVNKNLRMPSIVPFSSFHISV